jgi:hypothetical protein
MPIKVELKTNMREHGPIVRSAVAQMAKGMRSRSRDNVRSTGRLGAWGAMAVRTNVQKLSGGYLVNEVLTPRFLKAFETGAQSVGKPWLWIPSPPNKVRIGKRQTKLWRPSGTNVLIDRKTRQILYVGIRQTTIRKRLALTEIAEEEAAKLILYMMQGIRDGGKSLSQGGQ